MAKAPKYQGSNPLDRLRAGEPFFFIRAQDKLSVDAVRAYSHLLQAEADKALARGEDELFHSLQLQSIEVIGHAHKFLDWQEENEDLVKYPD